MQPSRTPFRRSIIDPTRNGWVVDMSGAENPTLWYFDKLADARRFVRLCDKGINAYDAGYIVYMGFPDHVDTVLMYL